MYRLIGYISITKQEQGLVTPVFSDEMGALVVIETLSYNDFQVRELSENMQHCLVKDDRLLQKNITIPRNNIKPVHLCLMSDTVIVETDKALFISEILKSLPTLEIGLTIVENKNLLLHLGLTGLAKKQYETLHQDHKFDFQFLHPQLKTLSDVPEDFITEFSSIFLPDFKENLISSYGLKEVLHFDAQLYAFGFRFDYDFFSETFLQSGVFNPYLNSRYAIETIIVLSVHLGCDFGFLKEFLNINPLFSKVPETEEFKSMILNLFDDYKFSEAEQEIINMLSGIVSEKKTNEVCSPAFLSAKEEFELLYEMHKEPKVNVAISEEALQQDLVATDQLASKVFESSYK